METQPRLHFLLCYLIASVACICNISLCASNMGKFWMQSSFHIISSYESWYYSFLFHKEKAFPFCLSIKNFPFPTCQSPAAACPCNTTCNVMARGGSRLGAVEAAPVFRGCPPPTLPEVHRPSAHRSDHGSPFQVVLVIGLFKMSSGSFLSCVLQCSVWCQITTNLWDIKYFQNDTEVLLW